MNEECINCSVLQDQLDEAQGDASFYEREADEYKDRYYEADESANHYMSVAQSLVSLVRKIGEEVPHIYMFLETDTFNEMKDWLDKRESVL